MATTRSFIKLLSHIRNCENVWNDVWSGVGVAAGDAAWHLRLVPSYKSYRHRSSTPKHAHK